MHRDLERHRRQEMSTLFSSLRSVLPADYIKGKRSTSDHVAEAVNYIKDLEKNVKELGEKRDELRNSEEGGGRGSSSSSSRLNNVEIDQFPGGLQIEINVAIEVDDDFSLSSAIRVVEEEGAGVVSCSSNKVNERVIYNLICEVSDDRKCFDVSQLYQRLVDLVG